MRPLAEALTYGVIEGSLACIFYSAVYWIAVRWDFITHCMLGGQC